MKSKGARLTTEISLPGRFVVFVPHGEGLGVSRRLEDDERTRLRDILKRLDVKKGGVIIRTAAEGASAEDIERDLVFLQRLWKTIETQAKAAKAPSLVYQEAELPLRVIRDLFTEDFERALVDHERTYKRVVGYLKKTSPHMADRVVRYREKTPLMESSGVDAEIRSTLSRRVDLPSGGYLVFDYAEAFTVIDVNTAASSAAAASRPAAGSRTRSRRTTSRRSRRSCASCGCATSAGSSSSTSSTWRTRRTARPSRRRSRPSWSATGRRPTWSRSRRSGSSR